MTPQTPETLRTQTLSPINGTRKAAMFLMGIGDTVSAGIIRQLAPDEIRRITGEIAALEAVAPEQMLEVFREFESMAATSRFFAKGGPETARRLIGQAFGEESALDLLAPPTPAPAAATVQNGSAPGPLDEIDPKELAKLVREENPQTLALILTNLPPAKGGTLMASLPEEVQAQVALRIALMDRISPEVFRRIAGAIQARFKASRTLHRSSGPRALASILNNVDGALSERVLTTIEEENQTTAASVRMLMFVFEDVVNIDKEGIKALLAKVDRKILTVALKGAATKIREHFTQCMSSRSAEMLVEDMEALGPVRIREVTEAQQQIVAAIRQLQKDGTIASSRGGGGDEYVV
jgi:flagellar motor switch protein FliG